MSSRDKKLLVYLGALIIVAVAYFLVGRPFLDKIDQQSGEKAQLTQELNKKRKAFENKEMYEQGIIEATSKINAIIDEFPEDNSDEKSIMFIHHAEHDIPIWVNKIQFAEETKNMVNGEEVQSASEVEQEQLEENVEAAEGEGGGEPADGSESGRGGDVTEQSVIAGLVSRDTELGIEFSSQYDEFKKLLAYIRNYEDRIVIKDIEVSYDQYAGLVRGNMVLSQYAILSEGRTLPDVITDYDRLGTDNIFIPQEKGEGILDIIADAMADLFNRIMGGLSSEAAEEFAADYFMRVNAVTDNTSGKTIGRANDLQQSSYVISDENGSEDVTFAISGSEGTYAVKYSIGDEKHEETLEKEVGSTVYLRIVSTERMSDSDKVLVALHVVNNSDLPLSVAIEGDDENNPRIDVVEQDGDVTIK